MTFSDFVLYRKSNGIEIFTLKLEVRGLNYSLKKKKKRQSSVCDIEITIDYIINIIKLIEFRNGIKHMENVPYEIRMKQSLAKRHV